MPNSRRRGGVRRKRGKRKARGKNVSYFPLTKVPRGGAFDSPVPPESDHELHFYVNFVLSNTGQTYAAVRFYTNAAFSPDIVTPANKPVGFTQLAGLYSKYRVIGYEYDIKLYTRETFGFTVMVRNTNADPGTSSGQLAYVGEALSSAKIVPTAGSPPIHFHGKYTIAGVSGRPIETDDTYEAAVTTVPSNVTFLGIFLQALTETFTASTGANISLHIKQKVRFFERKELNDTFAYYQRCTSDPPHSNAQGIPYIIDTGLEARRFAARETLSSLQA